MKKWIAALLTAVLLCGCASTAAPEATAPETTVEITQTTQPPTEATDAPAQPPVVTKDPTGEKLAPGGKTWFVARAEGASILTRGGPASPARAGPPRRSHRRTAWPTCSHPRSSTR